VKHWVWHALARLAGLRRDPQVNTEAASAKASATPIYRFVQDRSGAVTVDFVILVAAGIGLAFTLASSIAYATRDASNDVARCVKIQKNITKRDIPYKTKLKRMNRRCGRI